MKKLIAGVILLGLLGACSNKKAKIDPFASITQEVDSIRHKADSIHLDELPEDPQPIQADESFDDFIYNFASDDVLQRQRVKFPLPYYNGDKKANVRTERNCKIRPGWIRTTDVSSRSPGALRRWRARISERQIFCGSSAIRCHPSGSLRFPLLLTRYPAVFRMQMRMDLLCTVLFRPVCGCNIYTSFPRSRPE